MSTKSRGDKGEELVIAEISKINLYNKLLNNFTYIHTKNKSSHQIDHILIHPHGVFVIETKNYFGEMVGNNKGELWYKVIRNEKIIIANPISQNKSHCYYINQILNKKYPIISVVVYTKNNAPYLDDENVINLNDLLLFIESYPYEKLLSEKEIDKIYQKLEDCNASISHQEHIDNVKKVKEKKDQIREEMRYAIEEGLCPKCNNKILVKGYTYSCSKCKYKFTL